MGGAKRWLAAAIGLTAVLALLTVLALSSGAASAQDADTARIEIELTQADDRHELVLYEPFDDGTNRREIRRDSGVTGARWIADVEPGCYVVRIERTDGIPGSWLNPISNQPAFCLDAGQTGRHVTGALTRLSAGRPILNGTVVDPDGDPVAGAVVDFFDPPIGLGADDVRLLAHDAADHRGPFRFSQTTGSDGTWRFSEFGPPCFVQTFTAPDGHTWAGGRRYLNRSACTSEAITLVAYPDGSAPPPDGFLLVEVPASVEASGLVVSVGPRADNTVPSGRWVRTGIPYGQRLRVPAGCHVVSFDIGDASTIWTAATSSIQTVPVCVTSGGVVRVSPAPATRQIDYDLDLPFLIGAMVEDVDDRFRPVPGVQIDLFYPIDGITDDELRLVDHRQRDYRGDFSTSTTTSGDGDVVLPTFARCLVATLIAPDGYEFVDSDGRFLQETWCQEPDALFRVLRPIGRQDVDFGGRIVTESGAPVDGIVVDVFAPIDGIGDDELPTVDHTTTDYRGGYRQTATTGTDGRFAFAAESRCWVLTYIGNDTVRFPTGQYLRQTMCPGDSPTVVVPDVDAEPASIAGSVIGGPEVTADLFAANADGTRGAWLGDTTTVGGAYDFDVSPGCYVTVLIAPDGFVFVASGARWQQMPACVQADQTVINPDGQLRPS